MSRLVSICLCAVMAFVALCGASLVDPVPALAATGTLTMDTPLHQEPDPAAPVIALLGEGAVVTIDGPPVDGFYPVTAGNLSGWMRGETLQLQKDIVDEWAESQATPDEASQSVPVEQEAVDAATTEATGEVVADPVVSDPAPESASTESVNETGEESRAADAVTSDTEAMATEAVPADVATDVPTETAAAPPATSDPNIAPMPVVESGPTGAASATVDTPIRVGPGPDFDLITTAPAGSTVQQTGHLVDGYISVQFADITGWAAVDQLGAPGAVAAEPTPADPTATDSSAAPLAAETTEATARATETATPSPEPAPTGPASTLVDMPVRDGPGPRYGLIFTVPQGSAVEQTGELIDGYVSVRYKEVVGWAAHEQLGEPIDYAEETIPEETAEPVETKEPKPGSGVAYATVDLSLRAGPSANEEPIVVVPAGSRVVLTGVMEGEFQRVTYGDQVGWVSNDYLATPEDPKPNAERKGNRQRYSEREIVRIIAQAADRYDQNKNAMVRVARCESNLDPFAVNPSGSYGLFQFIRSTWKSTPYGDEDIFDPKANANAAAWMWAQGRKSEWVCQ